MPTPILMPPIVISHSNSSQSSDDLKQILAFGIAIHLLPILWIIITYIIAKIKRDRYYDTFCDCDIAWLSLIVLFSIDVLAALSHFIYLIL